MRDDKETRLPTINTGMSNLKSARELHRKHRKFGCNSVKLVGKQENLTCCMSYIEMILPMTLHLPFLSHQTHSPFTSFHLTYL